MTAREDEAEPVVLHVAHQIDRLIALVEQRGLRMTVVADALTAEAIDGAIASGRGDPAARIRRKSGGRPPLARNEERLLDHLFGDVDVAEETDQVGDHSAGFLSEDPVEIGAFERVMADWQRQLIGWRCGLSAEQRKRYGAPARSGR